MNPDTWPLFFLGAGRAYLFDGCSIATGPLAATTGNDALNVWDDVEQEIARGRPFQLKPVLDRLASGLQSSAELLERTFHCADARGGLRVYASTGSSASGLMGALSSPKGPWADRFPIVFLDSLPVGSADHRNAPDKPLKTPKALVYCNPTGDPLVQARRDAEAYASGLEKYCDVELLVRDLGAREYADAIADAQIFCYCGHGKLVSGLAAIPRATGWIPLLPDPHRSPEVTVFGACLGGGATTRAPAAGILVHPVARLADRPSAFLASFIESLGSIWQSGGGECGRGALLAWMKAVEADRRAGDVRRFIFQMRAADLP